MTKIIISVILLISFQGLFGQNIKTQPPETNIFQVMADSEFDFIIRINRDMNDKELKSRIKLLRSLNENIEVHYTRDESGNIKTLSSSGGGGGSCESDDFGFLIIAIKDNHSKGCMISVKE